MPSITVLPPSPDLSISITVMSEAEPLPAQATSPSPFDDFYVAAGIEINVQAATPPTSIATTIRGDTPINIKHKIRESRPPLTPLLGSPGSSIHLPGVGLFGLGISMENTLVGAAIKIAPVSLPAARSRPLVGLGTRMLSAPA